MHRWCLLSIARPWGESAAAIAKGFRDYDPEVNFGGVILNRLGSANHERMVREGMDKIGVPVNWCYLSR